MNLINTSGRCSACSGLVKNIDGRRHTRERLEDIHRESCPGLMRARRKEST
jgi:hypothetical protein